MKLGNNFKWWMLATTSKFLLCLYLLLFLILAIPLFIITLPVMLPREIVIFFIHRRIICNTFCRKCDVRLGRESIAESKRLLSKQMDEFRRTHPNVKYTHLREHDAVCINCGQEYEYHGQGRCYLPVKESF